MGRVSASRYSPRGVPITARAVTIRRPMPSTAGVWPFCQPEPLCELAQLVKVRGKHVMVYSGYTLEQLLEMGKTKPAVLRLLRLADTLVDGRYVEELRDLTLEFRGSSNQRIIDLHTVFDV